MTPCNEASREVANMCAFSKNGEVGLFKQCFKLKSNFLHKHNYPVLHHSQGSMKFATQISPLLNYLLTDL